MLRINFSPMLLGILLVTNVAIAGDETHQLPNLPGQQGGANIDMATLRHQVDEANRKAGAMVPEMVLPGAGDAHRSQSEDADGEKAKPSQSSQMAIGEQAAKEAMEKYNAGMKPKVAEEVSRQEKSCSSCSVSDSIPGAEADAVTADPEADSSNTKVVRGLREKFFDENEKLYLFISSSMPDSTVRAYLERVAVAGKDEQVETVMFGMVGGMENGKEAMSEYLARALLVNPDCKDSVEAICQRYPINLSINPAVFKKFKITKVPCVVYVRGENYWTVDGDSSLEFLLKKINVELKETSIDNLILSINERS